MKTNGAQRAAKPRKNGAGKAAAETMEETKPLPPEFMLIRRGEIIRIFTNEKEAVASGNRRFRDRDFLVLEGPAAMRELGRFAKLFNADVRLNNRALDTKRKQLAKKHPGNYVLMKGGRIFGYYNTKNQAKAAGKKRFRDGVFSALQIEKNLPVYYSPHLEMVK